MSESAYLWVEVSASLSLIVFAETYPSVPLSVCWWKGVCSQEETNSSAFTQHSGNQLYSCKIETVSSSFCPPSPLFFPLTLISSSTYLNFTILQFFSANVNLKYMIKENTVGDQNQNTLFIVLNSMWCLL